ncbi:hypothetical protein [Kordia sp.]|uniref:hypothetical protein n=1 Tax=Kordia sp. TaxID=1965332 RepID=UPI003D2CEF8B
MLVVKILLMFISGICICFSLFATSLIFVKSVAWYEVGFACLALITACLNVFYHIKSFRYYGKNATLIGIEKFSKKWLIVPLIFSAFFVWLVAEIAWFIKEKMEMDISYYAFFDTFIGLVFLSIALVSVKEVVTFYEKIQNGELYKNEISDIGTPIL